MTSKIDSVFYQEFRSITLLLESKGIENQLSLPVKMYMDWISKYDSWWTNATGISRGKNLNLLYGRNITCAGYRLLRFTRELLDIASLSSSIGCLFSTTIDLEELIEQRRLFEQLINSGHVNVLYLEAKRINKKYGLLEYLPLIEAIIKKGISLNLRGPVDLWKALGILNSQTLNSSRFRIIPSMSDKPINLSYIVPNVSQINKKRKAKFFGYSFNPCSERFQIYITPGGDIYPCKGLIGIASCKLGTIYDNIENTVLGGGKDVLLDFKDLARQGPKLQFDDTISNYLGLPPICFYHRNSVLEKQCP